MRVTAFLAMGIVLSASAAGAEGPVRAALAPAREVARVVHAPLADKAGLETASATGVDMPSLSWSLRGDAPPAADAGWASKLAPIEIFNKNTNARGKVRLYDDRGEVDRGQARAFMRIASRLTEAADDASDDYVLGGHADDDERLDLRLVQLVVRASYHFGGATVQIISGTRPGAKGRHGNGEALDFSLDGVKAPLLAAYLRGTPLAGVGIYTHPKTQYVHLDVRERSFHWIDGSPPGVTWREQLLSDPKQAARDASYVPALDLPEH